jgi:hypothetical protein
LPYLEGLKAMEEIDMRAKIHGDLKEYDKSVEVLV